MILNDYILHSFLLKIGNKAYSDICIRIKSELKNNGYSFQIEDNYLSYILEIAILINCDIDISKISTIIKGMGNNYVPPIDFEKLLKIHSSSINLIKSYLN